MAENTVQVDTAKLDEYAAQLKALKTQCDGISFSITNPVSGKGQVVDDITALDAQLTLIRTALSELISASSQFVSQYSEKFNDAQNMASAEKIGQ